MTPKQEKALIAKIIKLHGPVIDLRKSPGIIIDIMRRFDETPDGGTPCGGVPPGPVGPSPSRAGGRITTDELMKALLTLTREVASIKKAVVVKSQVARKATAKAKTSKGKTRR
jgi:hypothetical protein